MRLLLLSLSMRFFLVLILFAAGCHGHRTCAAPPTVPQPDTSLPPMPIITVNFPKPQAWVVNPGAILEIVVMNQAQMDQLIQIPGYTVGGYAPPDRLEVWVVIADIEGGQFTPIEAGVLAHELAHKADQMKVSYWRILFLASTENFPLDTHNLGQLPQGVMSE